MHKITKIEINNTKSLTKISKIGILMLDKKLMENQDYIYSQLGMFPIDPDEPVFTTGVVSRLLTIPVWVLKKLDEEQIVSPHRKSELDARLYSLNELSLLNHCWKYMNEHKVKVNALKVILRIEFKQE